MARHHQRTAQVLFLAVLAASLGAAMYQGMRHPGSGQSPNEFGTSPPQWAQALAASAEGHDKMRKELLEKLIGAPLTPTTDPKDLEGKWEVRSVRDAGAAAWVRDYRSDGRLIVTHLDAGAAREEASWAMVHGILMEQYAGDDADPDAAPPMHLYRRADGELVESTDDAQVVYALARVKE